MNLTHTNQNITQNHNIKAVCFDAGSTLVFPDYYFIQKLLTQYGVSTTVDRLKETEYEAKFAAHKTRSSKPWKIYFGTWFKSAGVKEDDFPEIFNELWQRHRQRNLWSLLDKDAVETLTELKNQNYQLGVISNSDGRLKHLFEELEILKYFDVIVDSDLIGIRKPDKAIFHYALTKLNLQPDAVLYIGDSYEIDIVGAQNAGLNSVLFDPLGNFNHLNCLKINRLKQLFDLI